MLMTINNDLPAGISYSEDQTCEKILREIAAEVPPCMPRTSHT